MVLVSLTVFSYTLHTGTAMPSIQKGDPVLELSSRLYHCHKINRHITIFEDYVIVDGKKRLVRCSCPYHKYTDMKPHCDGNTEFGFLCSFAKN